MFVYCVKIRDYDSGILSNVRKGITTANITRHFARNLLHCVNEHNARLLLFILSLRLNDSDLRRILVSKMNIDYTKKNNSTWHTNKCPHVFSAMLIIFIFYKSIA